MSVNVLTQYRHRRCLASRAIGGVAHADAIADAIKACDRGKGASCVAAGQHFENGPGVTPEPGKALSYFLQACALDVALGCRHAAANVSRGATVDFARVSALYEKSCDLKDGASCTILGLAWSQGGAASVGKKDHFKAGTFFDRACTLGDGQAVANAAFSTPPDVA